MSSGINATQITWHEGTVSREQRTKLMKQEGCTLWFTGLSGSGKSTIAIALEQALIQRGHAAYVLDGDNIRFGINASPKILIESRRYTESSAKRFGLAFSAEDREENIRRIGEVAKLFADSGMITLASFISPYRKDRDAVRSIHEKNATGALKFLEIYVKTSIDICEQRDPKGLYKQARAAVASGKGMGFTGIDDPYEEPLNPELIVDNGTNPIETVVGSILNYLQEQKILSY